MIKSICTLAIIVTIQQEFHQLYRAGKQALERGQYRQSVEQLQAASKLVAPASRLGGEVNIWLVSAYQALGQPQAAIALCQKLSAHPSPEVRKQSQRLLYIIQAPQLNRPKEWMSEIPDLSALEESQPQDRRGSNTVRRKTTATLEETSLDLSQRETNDNQFIWVALLILLLGLGGFVWLS
ncbi:MAG: tetratricopeptide repeat protein [Cyanophyceae cyanobacterium]